MELTEEPLKIQLILPAEKPTQTFSKTAALVGITVWLTAVFIVSYHCFENELIQFSADVYKKVNTVLDFDGEGESLLTSMKHTDSEHSSQPFHNEPQTCSRDSTRDSCGSNSGFGKESIPPENPGKEMNDKESVKVEDPKKSLPLPITDKSKKPVEMNEDEPVQFMDNSKDVLDGHKKMNKKVPPASNHISEKSHQEVRKNISDLNKSSDSTQEVKTNQDSEINENAGKLAIEKEISSQNYDETLDINTENKTPEPQTQSKPEHPFKGPEKVPEIKFKNTESTPIIETEVVTEGSSSQIIDHEEANTQKQSQFIETGHNYHYTTPKPILENPGLEPGTSIPSLTTKPYYLKDSRQNPPLNEAKNKLTSFENGTLFDNQNTSLTDNLALDLSNEFRSQIPSGPLSYKVNQSVNDTHSEEQVKSGNLTNDINHDFLKQSSQLEGHSENPITNQPEDKIDDTVLLTPPEILTNKVVDYNAGEIRSVGRDYCVESGSSEGDQLSLYTCHGGENQNWIYNEQYEIRKADLCMDYFGGPGVFLFECHGMQANQRWNYDPSNESFYHPSSKYCLTLLDDMNVGMRACDDKLDTQRWLWRYTTGPSTPID